MIKISHGRACEKFHMGSGHDDCAQSNFTQLNCVQGCWHFELKSARGRGHQAGRKKIVRHLIARKVTPRRLARLIKISQALRVTGQGGAQKKWVGATS